MEENNQAQEENVKNLLEENLRLTKEIHQMSRRISRHVTFQKIMSLIYFLLIVVPLILGAIYLPTLIQSFLSPYQELLDSGKNMGNTLNDPSAAGLGDILKQAQELLDKNKNNK